MARSKSGRIVLEVDPVLKHALYVELVREDLTLREWFIAQAQRYIAQRRQPGLFAAELRPLCAPDKS